MWPNRSRIAGALICAALVAGAFAEQRTRAAAATPMVAHEVRKVSDHVWVIDGSKSKGAFPNIGIIVGSRATLVVDTGVGRSAEIVVEEMKKLSSNPILYLTFTHFHTEHASGAYLFPANTTLIYPEATQRDIDVGLAAHVERFRGNPLFKELLEDWKPRPADIIFDSKAKIDLGGVTASLMYLGPGHTFGDNLIYVEQDGLLFPGDIVQVRMFPNIAYRFDASAGVGPNATGWLAMLDKVEALHPRIIIPDHGAFPADASWIGKERDYLQSLKTRVQELKKQGKSIDEIGNIVTPEFQAKYPDWTPVNAISPAAQRFYSELP